VHKAVKGFKNLKIEVPINKERKKQIMDSSSKKCLNDLHNKNSNLKIELI